MVRGRLGHHQLAHEHLRQRGKDRTAQHQHRAERLAVAGRLARQHGEPRADSTIITPISPSATEAMRNRPHLLAQKHRRKHHHQQAARHSRSPSPPAAADRPARQSPAPSPAFPSTRARHGPVGLWRRNPVRNSRRSASQTTITGMAKNDRKNTASPGGHMLRRRLDHRRHHDEHQHRAQLQYDPAQGAHLSSVGLTHRPGLQVFAAFPHWTKPPP